MTVYGCDVINNQTSVDLEILEYAQLLGKVRLLDLSHPLPQFPLLLLLPLDAFKVWLESEQVLTDFVHPDWLR
jgi:hypothetical protein